MMKKILFLIVFLLLLNPLHAEMTPGDISYYTEEYPPYNFSDNGMATGFATEILLKMFEKLNVNKTAKDIRVVPWARGFNDIQKKKNVCLYTMTRTDERVKKYGFRWVGPIINTGSVLFAQKSKNIKINSMEDVKNIVSVRSEMMLLNRPLSEWAILLMMLIALPVRCQSQKNIERSLSIMALW
ncbi:MAG: amino acid ABC transporter periplasmic protein [Candidatus Magnetoglobus multicellularis str. Araruama]|uniref:Amino acid ABC transporter periplasmic protein n=1 Tax=Candidatus Magnetoglobus multicellularis str. Araruama TaxID=890399 RepID=A0A1V1PIC5_9BACT|nr:MAG: amino acid ABC transporter periplasmic protein [Candidatus Magnetoglobus multicellularis str. Araruama]